MSSTVTFEEMRDRLKAHLRTLNEIAGLSGFEQDVVAHLRAAFSEVADEVHVDGFGNLYATRRGTSAGPTLLLTAHSDEIGCVVKSIRPDGFLRIERVGGVLASLLVGRKVVVNGRYGVIGSKLGHMQTEAERQRVVPTEDLYVDVGAEDAAEVAALGIRIGDPVTYLSELGEYSNPNRISGKAIDNRISCAILIETLRLLSAADIAGTVQVLVATQEEVGLRGATVAMRNLRPDLALVLDTFMAGDTPDVSSEAMPTRLGAGPVFLLLSGGQVGHITHPAVKRLLLAAAEQAQIPYQLATGLNIATTDAAAIHLSGSGIPTGGIGIARRYSHSPICTLDLRDAVHTVHLLPAVVAALRDPALSLAFLE
ncbi:MAG TPA: M28 family peptidase [Chloroflexota bacterium]|jgi:endoglucanase|nr:M28 family peptidase [Chloroflexota bacterium]